MHEGMRRLPACSEESALTAQARAGSVPLSLTGGAVHDSPAATDADPLSSVRDCCAATLEAGHGYWQQRERGGWGQLPFAPVSRVGVCDRWAAVG